MSESGRPILSAWTTGRWASEHQLSSYLELVRRGVPAVVARENRYFTLLKEDAEYGVVKFGVALSRPRWRRPVVSPEGGPYVRMVPALARQLDLTYSLALECDAEVTTEWTDPGGAQRREQRVFPAVAIGEIPLMCGSAYCWLDGMSREELAASGEDPDDPGGYFIVDGMERVMVTDEREAPNLPVLSTETAGGKVVHKAFVRSAPVDGSGQTYGTYARTEARGKAGRVVVVEVPPLRSAVDVATLFRALGVTSDRDIADYVCAGDEALEAALAPSLALPGLPRTQLDALRAMAPLTPFGRSSADNGLNQLNYVLMTQTMPGRVIRSGGEHRPEPSLLPRAVALARLVRRLLMLSIGAAPETDKDSFLAKRLQTPGVTLEKAFDAAFVLWRRQAVSRIDFHFAAGLWRLSGSPDTTVNPDNLADVMSGSALTAGVLRELKARSQALERKSWVGFLAELRKVESSVDPGSKMTAPRMLHLSSFGVCCPLDSPSGGAVGLSKHLAIGCAISSGDPPWAVLDLLDSSPLCSQCFDVEPRDALRGAVCVNGVITHHTASPGALAAELRAARASGRIPPLSSVVWVRAASEVHVWTDAGRPLRMLVPLAGGRPAAPAEAGESWASLRARGAVDMLSPEETDGLYIATSVEEATPAHTHAEVDPLCMVSITIAAIPFVGHSQVTRIAYATAQVKQAASHRASSLFSRSDETSFTLDAPHLPLVRSSAAAALSLDRHPYGTNVTCAVMCWGGHNQDDGLVVSLAAVQRGMMCCTLRHCRRASESARSDPPRRFDPGSIRRVGDVVLADQTLAAAGDRDATAVKADHLSRVESAQLWTRGLGPSPLSPSESRLKLSLLTAKPVSIGDKLASRHGQKGVVGAMPAPWQLPVLEDGSTPDVLFNPHGFVRRMCVGQLIEMGASGVARSEARTTHPLARHPRAHDPVGGDRLMYSAETGRCIGAVFAGPLHMLRLKHIAKDKVSSRPAGGRVELVSRQPAKAGNLVGGGVRIGEMERDAVVAHGMAATIHELFGRKSDGAVAHVDIDGAPAHAGYPSRYPRDVVAGRLVCPRSATVMRHELAQAGIGADLVPSPPPVWAPRAPRADTPGPPPDTGPDGRDDAGPDPARGPPPEPA